MKTNVRKTVIVLGTILFWLGAIAGCEKKQDTLESRIVGKYSHRGGIVEFGQNGKLCDTNGDIDPRFSWNIENGLVQIYDNEFGGKEWENGRLVGGDIVFDVITRDGIEVVRFLKQDGKARPAPEGPQKTSQREETGGVSSIPEVEKLWVKCTNKACNAEYQMSWSEYYKALETSPNLNPMATLKITCEKCGKPSLCAAIKCSNPDCGDVFIEGSAGPDYHGYRCPKCGQERPSGITREPITRR